MIHTFRPTTNNSKTINTTTKKNLTIALLDPYAKRQHVKQILSDKQLKRQRTRDTTSSESNFLPNTVAIQAIGWDIISKSGVNLNAHPRYTFKVAHQIISLSIKSNKMHFTFGIDANQQRIRCRKKLQTILWAEFDPHYYQCQHQVPNSHANPQRAMISSAGNFTGNNKNYGTT